MVSASPVVEQVLLFALRGRTTQKLLQSLSLRAPFVNNYDTRGFDISLSERHN